MVSVVISEVSSIDELEPFDNEYVYDVGVGSGDPYFFGNDILVHNSSYFSAYALLKDDPNVTDIMTSRDKIVDFYLVIEELVNESFPIFMKEHFNTSLERGSIIQAGLELVASTGLFIKKKKYAVLKYYDDGTRVDTNGKVGKLKAMGLDLKRADTPKFMQKFLEEILMDILTGKTQQSMFDKIKSFRKEFSKRPAWEKGTPKKVNNLSTPLSKKQHYAQVSVMDKMKKGETARVAMAGHVTASINWNHLRESSRDRYSKVIADGGKVIVCKLKDNLMKMTSIAFPIDETHLPDWFKNLPFDEKEMENVIIDKKLTNLVGVLGWDLEKTKESDSDEFFVFK